jgi:hypothetical protein
VHINRDIMRSHRDLPSSHRWLVYSTECRHQAAHRERRSVPSSSFRQIHCSQSNTGPPGGRRA